MKILFYNWVDFLDDENRGGGVSVYQRNLLEELCKNNDHELYFLCSGISYDLFNIDVRIEKIKHGKKNLNNNILWKVKRYEIVNSKVLSPGHLSFGDDNQVFNTEMNQLFANFVQKHGGFDVIHFNNLEGIPASFLEIKKLYPSTKIILSMHNYYPFCSQVNLWYNESELCEDYFYGKKCISCIPNQAKKEVVIRSNSSAYTLKKIGINPTSKYFFRPFITLAGIKKRIDTKINDKRYKDKKIFYRVSGHPFMERREAIVNMINENCDHVLAVSQRVAEITIKYGVCSEIVCVDYIGTKFAELYDKVENPTGRIPTLGKLNLAYLGYMRNDKGFFFLVDALYDMPPKIAENINLIIVAKNTNQEALNKIYHQIWKFNDIYYSNGYNHKNLDSILEKVDIGIIPSLWEDNLPQVAIEYHSRKIPIITSNRGGASELANNPNYVYDSLDKEQLYNILEKIIQGELTHDDYWSWARRPVSMSEHCNKLIKEFYKR